MAQRSDAVPGGELFDKHGRQVAAATSEIQDFIGPLPAIVATPFFGMALLTGAALLSEQPFIANSNSSIVSHLRDSPLLRQTRSYANWWIFGILLALAVLSVLANSGKVQGVPGKALRVAETFLMGIAYLLLNSHALIASQPPSVSRGFVLSPIAAVALPAFAFGPLTLFVSGALALMAMMIVRLAFDVLIWFVPFPFIDLIFEIVKNVGSFLFLLLYLLNPILATAIACALFILCLPLLFWSLRLERFMYWIIFRPALARWVHKFQVEPVNRKLALRMSCNDARLAVRAHALKLRGFRKRQAICLIHNGNGCFVSRLGSRKARLLCNPTERLVLGRALAWLEVRAIDSQGRTIAKLALPRSLDAHRKHIATQLGAEDAGDFGSRKTLANMLQPPRQQSPAGGSSGTV